MPERLNPGISAHTTVSLCVTSAGGTRCQVPDVPGWPCSSPVRFDSEWSRIATFGWPQTVLRAGEQWGAHRARGAHAIDGHQRRGALLASRH